ncbi:MAG: hypothetical protein M3Q11_01990 [Pseudomonadota bacterium]|nr:hypothetical protein [Pseudomonadota bacterium]
MRLLILRGKRLSLVTFFGAISKKVTRLQAEAFALDLLSSKAIKPSRSKASGLKAEFISFGKRQSPKGYPAGKTEPKKNASPQDHKP